MTSRDPDLAVSVVLRTGLYVSTALLTVGWIAHRADLVPIGSFGAETLTGGQGLTAAVLWWGLTLLVLTPVARIVTTIIAYSRRPRLRVFALLAIVSLSVICFGAYFGVAPT